MAAAKFLLIDGHPAADRLSSYLLDEYAESCPADAAITRIAIRDLAFDPILHQGYEGNQPWEADLEKAARQIDEADHIVFAFPMWWGGEPAIVKGFIDRILLPHFAYRYRDKGDLWDKLLAGRSADILVSMDTPAFFLRLMFKSPIVHRWRGQLMGFCGIKPARFHIFAPIRKGNADKQMDKWQQRIQKIAMSASGLKRMPKQSHLDDFLAYRDKPEA